MEYGIRSAINVLIVPETGNLPEITRVQVGCVIFSCGSIKKYEYRNENI